MRQHWQPVATAVWLRCWHALAHTHRRSLGSPLVTRATALDVFFAFLACTQPPALSTQATKERLKSYVVGTTTTASVKRDTPQSDTSTLTLHTSPSSTLNTQTMADRCVECPDLRSPLCFSIWGTCDACCRRCRWCVRLSEGVEWRGRAALAQGIHEGIIFFFDIPMVYIAHAG